MILTKLILVDFGLYGGRHEFYLRPQQTSSETRPIILFGGKNGSGKTTILEAVRLCLYGRDALGVRVSQREYEAYLRKRIHHSEQRSPRAASVILEFEYPENSQLSFYSLERTWEYENSEVTEHLALRRNGELQFGLGPEYWQHLLKDLIPLGLADLFFFDGERIQSLADDERGGQTLATALKDLLGVNLVEQLEADINVYLTRQAKVDGQSEAAARLEMLTTEQDRLTSMRADLRQDRAGLQSRLDFTLGKIYDKEEELTSRGGSFAQNRSKAEAHKQFLKTTIDEARHNLQELCAGLLPFSLAPKLSQALYDQLRQEEHIEHKRATSMVLHEQILKLEEQLYSEKFWSDIESDVPTTARQVITNRVRQVLLAEAAEAESEEIPIVHSLSSSDRGRLLQWIEQALTLVPQEAKRKLDTLMAAQVELEGVDRELQAAPPTELLAPIMQDLHILHTEAGRLKAKIAELTNEEERLNHQLLEIERDITKLTEQIRNSTRRQDKTALAAKVLELLPEFRQRLLRLKIADLEAVFTEYFNRLARKQGFVSHVIINELDFTMTLVSREGRYIPKALLSAGEKQIYAIALLWALRAVAARPLPVIIDTPLGRLDSSHRQNLVEHYFPNASHQVIVLSTDTEIDATYFAELAPYISHAYHLVYDDVLGMTRAEEGYFWQAPYAVEIAHAS